MLRLTLTHIVLYHLSICNPQREEPRYFTWKDDICGFIDTHWDVIMLGKTRTPTWHNTLAKELSTHPDIFLSGKLYNMKGSWALVNLLPPNPPASQTGASKRSKSSTASAKKSGAARGSNKLESPSMMLPPSSSYTSQSGFELMQTSAPSTVKKKKKKTELDFPMASVYYSDPRLASSSSTQHSDQWNSPTPSTASASRSLPAFKKKRSEQYSTPTVDSQHAAYASSSNSNEPTSPISCSARTLPRGPSTAKSSAAWAAAKFEADELKRRQALGIDASNAAATHEASEMRSNIPPAAPISTHASDSTPSVPQTSLLTNERTVEGMPSGHSVEVKRQDDTRVETVNAKTIEKRVDIPLGVEFSDKEAFGSKLMDSDNLGSHGVSYATDAQSALLSSENRKHISRAKANGETEAMDTALIEDMFSFVDPIKNSIAQMGTSVNSIETAATNSNDLFADFDDFDQNGYNDDIVMSDVPQRKSHAGKGLMKQMGNHMTVQSKLTPVTPQESYALIKQCEQALLQLENAPKTDSFQTTATTLRRLRRRLLLQQAQKLRGIRRLDVDALAHRSTREYRPDPEPMERRNLNVANSESFSSNVGKIKYDLDPDGNAVLVLGKRDWVIEKCVSKRIQCVKASGIRDIPLAFTLKSKLLGNPYRANTLTCLVPRVSAYTGEPLKPYIWRDDRSSGGLRKVPPQYLVLKTIQAMREDLDKSSDTPEVDEKCVIDYVHLQASHLGQVNEMLSRQFWPGIDVSEHLSLQDLSVVALYKRLVVGCGFIMPDGYISYIMVRPGWQRAGIARFMIYHLSQLVQAYGKDVTLHVSANNPAMMLYQSFGFKAEQFVVNFYDKYLSADSQDCKNAFFLRMRR
ncbi:Cysteine-rich protein 2-binding protein [Chytriomyces hyalinus]|nr:Cysteine-rich protein 2-binding protein [Chytriomyces hyalinus]